MRAIVFIHGIWSRVFPHRPESSKPEANPRLHEPHIVGYVCQAYRTQHFIDAMHDYTSVELTMDCLKELVLQGLLMEPMDWAAIGVYRDQHEEPVPSLARLQEAFRYRLEALGFADPRGVAWPVAS